jgi:hypothetical protein
MPERHQTREVQWIEIGHAQKKCTCLEVAYTDALFGQSEDPQRHFGQFRQRTDTTMMQLPANHRGEDFHTDKTHPQSKTLQADLQPRWQDLAHG